MSNKKDLYFDRLFKFVILLLLGRWCIRFCDIPVTSFIHLFLNLVPVLSLAIILTLFVGSTVLGCLLSCSLFEIATVANAAKLRELRVPLFFSDYLFIGDLIREARELAKFQTISEFYWVMAFALGISLYFIRYRKSLNPTLFKRILAVVLGLLIWQQITTPNSLIQSLYTTRYIGFDPLKAELTERNYGLGSHLMISAPVFFSKQPQNYGDPEIISKYLNLPNNSNTKTDNDARAVDLPNLLVILEESIFDVRSLDFPYSPAVEEVTISDQHTVSSGKLSVHTYGGATWISEYEFLTGVPSRLFGVRGYYSHLTLAKPGMKTLASTLKKLGYETIVIYPVEKAFMNAKRAYESYGFDKFVDVDDLGLSHSNWEHLENRLFFRKAVDEVRAIRQSQRKKPVFVMVLTVVAHGPYPLERFQQDHERHYFSEYHGPLTDHRKALTVYLEKYQRHMQDIRNLVSELRKLDKKVVLFRFGDHRPGSTLAPLLASRPDAYQTFYELWSNYEIKTPGNLETGPKEMDIIYASSYLLDVLGINQDLTTRVNSGVRRLCNGLYEKCMLTENVMASFQQFLYEQYR